MDAVCLPNCLEVSNFEKIVIENQDLKLRLKEMEETKRQLDTMCWELLNEKSQLQTVFAQLHSILQNREAVINDLTSQQAYHLSAAAANDELASRNREITELKSTVSTLQREIGSLVRERDCAIEELDIVSSDLIEAKQQIRRLAQTTTHLTD